MLGIPHVHYEDRLFRHVPVIKKGNLLVGVGELLILEMLLTMNIRIEEGALEVCATLYLYLLPLATKN